jgi:hypothetical protein
MSSAFDIQHNKKFDDLQLALSRDLTRISTDANGGKTILFVYPSNDEDQYISEAHRRFDDRFEFIDLRELFVEFVDSIGWEDFADVYKMEGTEVFKSVNYDGTFLDMILDAIKATINGGHYPVLIHTGSLYGMDFTNIDYMESKEVMNSPVPMVVFYPGHYDEKGNVIFLDKQVGSNYRCVKV